MRRLVGLCLFILLGFCQSASASIAGDVDTWLQLRDTGTCYNFAQYRHLIEDRPDWPEMAILRVQAEQALNDAPPDATTIIAWFKAHPPLGDNGKFLYLKTLVSEGYDTQAQSFLNAMWEKGSFNGDQQDMLLNTYGRWISGDARIKRLDALLWAANTKRAEKALQAVNGNAHNIGAARLALQRFDTSAMTIISALPVTAQQDPGLVYDLTHYYRERNQDERAALTLSHNRGDITDHAAQWWKERSILARRALEKGDFPAAYQLAAANGQQSGSELADAEWLAGWLAVTRLDRPDQALKHFDRMYRNVKSPISISRAAYWAGLAATKMHQPENAKQWYRLAAQHMHTFYGQMAAYALGNADDYYAAFFRRSVRIPSTDTEQGSLADAAKYLYKNGHEKERDIFLGALLAKNKDNPEKIIPLAKELHSPRIALSAAKAAYDKGILIGDALFPRLNVPRNADVEPALTLGIIRQESMFDPYAQSSARALGLMQLLPGTAQHIAQKNGLAHRNTAELFEPQHNMVLGQAYLNSMLTRYGGNVPLAAAAYNAGPGNVDNWVAEMGDPSGDKNSWVDWVERIPFYETRNYVQRVWESYQVYKYMGDIRPARTTAIR